MEKAINNKIYNAVLYQPQMRRIIGEMVRDYSETHNFLDKRMVTSVPQIPDWLESKTEIYIEKVIHTGTEWQIGGKYGQNSVEQLSRDWNGSYSNISF